MRAVAMATVIGVALLVGCAAQAPHDPVQTDPVPTHSVPPNSGTEGVPGGAFVGPWADLFELTYREAASDDERRALADGEISPEEYAFFQDQIRKCLAGLGVTASFGSDGQLTYTKPPEVTRDEIQRCNAENGIQVLALHDAVARNPTHQDETAMMLACLRRTGVVGDGYSAADLENGVDINKIGGDDDFVGCASDPLGYGAP